MPRIDLLFSVQGEQLPTDHVYALYSALCGHIPAFHDSTLSAAVAPIGGQYLGRGLLSLTGRSHLRVRVPVDQVPDLIPLAGKALEVAGHRILLGVPRVVGLTPAASLVARMVTIKGFTEPGEFLAAARRQLESLGVAGHADIPLITTGARAGEPRRRVVRIKDKRVVGFTLQVTGLSAEESIRLQEAGLGGRRKLGCGFFKALR